MAPCERCGTGTRSGRGKGWCSNVACREAEKKEKEEEKDAAKRLRQEERQRKGAAGQRGPCPDPAGRACKRARQEEREDKGAGERGPCPGEGGRPEDLAVQACRQARQEEREEKGAGERGPCPGEGAGGRPADSEEVQAEKLEARGVNQVGLIIWVVKRGTVSCSCHFVLLFGDTCTQP